MIGFEVSLNGKIITIAGHSEAVTLHAVLEAATSFPSVSLELTGELPPLVVASWGKHACRVADELRVRVIETSEVTEPVTVKQSVGELDSADSTSWPFCFLCGKSMHDVHAMVATNRAHVCDACIDDMIWDDKNKRG